MDTSRKLSGVALMVMLMAACGGGDDDGEAEGVATLESSTVSTAPTTTVTTVTTAASVESSATTTAAGGSEDTATKVPSPTTTAADSVSQEDLSELSDEEVFLLFSQCMRDQGIADFPDPTVDAQGNVSLQPPPGAEDPFEGMSQEEIGELLAQCDDYLQAIISRFDVPDPADFEDILLEFAECAREEGFDLPDPDFSSPGNPFGNDFDFTDPAFEAAAEACQDIVAGLGPGG